MTLSRELYQEFENIVGPDFISEDPAILVTYTTPMCQSQHHMGPAYGVSTPRGLAVILPASTEEVQSIVKICNKYKIKFKAASTFGCLGPIFQMMRLLRWTCDAWTGFWKSMRKINMR